MSSSKNCKCECTEALLKKLRKYEDQYVYLFEGDDWVVFGLVDKVKDGVVKLVYGYKFSPSNYTFFWFEKIYVSACEITEFIPVSYYTGSGTNRQEILNFLRGDIISSNPNP